MSEFEWNGGAVTAAVATAMGRATVAIAENVVVEAKQFAHVISGDLRRSIHSAAPGTDHEGDSFLALFRDIPNATEEDVVRVDGKAVLEVGSWLPYACVEETGRGHRFIEPAVELVNTRARDIVAQVMHEEGLDE